MTTRGSRITAALVLALAGSAFGALAQLPTFQTVVAIDPDLADAAIVASSSAYVSAGVQVSGNVVANDAFAAPTLVTGRSVQIDKPAVVTGDVAGDRVGLAKGATVNGSVHYNELFNNGATVGSLVTPLSLPVLAPMPPFHGANVNPGSANVAVGAGQTVTLEAGSYGDITVAQTGTLVFAGGVYDVRSLGLIAGSGTCTFPCRRFYFAAPSDLRVENRLDSGTNSAFGPAPSSGVSASQIIVYVGGANGGAGGPTATPSAVHVGRNSAVGVNFFAPFGTVQIDRDTAVTGALIGQHVKVDLNSTVSAASFFANLAPIAQPVTVFTLDDDTPPQNTITIVLEATDPEQEDLDFAIISTPSFGTLGALVEDPEPFEGNPPGCNPVNDDPCDRPGPARTRATVTYTATNPGNFEDSFSFTATDPHGAVGTATVRINPPGDPTPPEDELDTVRANDVQAETTLEVPVVVHLLADAPGTVSLTFTIVAAPADGELGVLVQGSETPRRSATVEYTPDDEFTGSDSFTFKACGEIESVEVCDEATATIAVADLATDQEVSTPENTQVTVFLSGVAGAGESARRNIRGRAAFLDGAEIAGNVADANDDGLGDNHNDLPGAAPVLMSAGVASAPGVGGSDGVRRMHIEWDISSLAGSTLESASVILSTNKGTIDSLDTFFFVGTAEGNGTLDDADFQFPAQQISGVVMPVPAGPAGTEGTFSFDILSQLNAALADDRGFLVIQGRVDEDAAVAPQRGLQVHTTASSNLANTLEPQLAIATPGVTPPPYEFTILSLPSFGTLRDSFGTIITEAPVLLANQIVRYIPNASFVGDDDFDFQVQDLSDNTATATIFIRVLAVVDACPDGRGC